MIILQKIFGYLHGIEGGTFANLIATEPEGEAVLEGKVFADAAHVDLVVAGCLKRHGVDELRGVVFHDDARGGFEGAARLVRRYLELGLYPDALAVTAQ